MLSARLAVRVSDSLMHVTHIAGLAALRPLSHGQTRGTAQDCRQVGTHPNRLAYSLLLPSLIPWGNARPAPFDALFVCVP